MLDFVEPGIRMKGGVVEIVPDYSLIFTDDIMIRGKNFYAIWDEENSIWSTSEKTAIRLIDKQLDIFAKKYKDAGETVRVMYLKKSGTKSIDAFHAYCQKQMTDNFIPLDEKLSFSNTVTKKKDYSSKRLPYELGKGSTEAWDTLMGVLYSPTELKKLEWSIGAIVNGDSKNIQKFVVLYGAPKTGKSTVLNIIDKMFKGYTSVFDAKSLGSSSAQFAMEAFKTNPLVGIQHDGDLSKIEDNTRINSIVSHETILVNEKNKPQYPQRFNVFLYMGTNKPVKITDSKSGLLRRLIDITPTGDRVKPDDYNRLMKQIEFELGAIAWKCKSVYEHNKRMFDDYVPINMMSASNNIYAFMEEKELLFREEDKTTLELAWERYDAWCEKYKQFRTPYLTFKEELKSYYKRYNKKGNVYSGFKLDAMDGDIKNVGENWLTLKEQESKFDILCHDRPAQYATPDEKPMYKWQSVKTTLKDIHTDQLHYVKPLLNEIVIDFDLKDETGQKSLAKNIEAAQSFPPTYAETSKSGNGLHLHYFYTGDISLLDSNYSENIEVKTFNGGSSLRRRLSLCNDLDISTISTGLPLKERKKKMVDYDRIKTEEDLKKNIARALRKERASSTSQCISFIFDDLEKAYESGLIYDVTDMQEAVMAFAGQSTNHPQECLRKVVSMHFKSKPIEEETNEAPEDAPIVIFDVEVFPNLFIVCWKFLGKDKPVNSMVNPRPIDIDTLLQYRLIGFNNLKYDNIILYARKQGYTNEMLYKLSKGIIGGEKSELEYSARDVSWTDIFDFCSTKQSLKKWEIQLARKDPSLIHLENAIAWDEDVPEDRWNEVVEYCKNDVIATEAVWLANQTDFTAREIMADLTGMNVNTRTNTLSGKFIFGNNKNPQGEFNYRFMGIPEDQVSVKHMVPGLNCNWNYTVFDDKGRPLFPGYVHEYDPEYKQVVSKYRGEVIGQGGYVYSEPGMYHNVKVFDIASMHPSTIIAENLFGDRYTQRFKEIVELRIAIKHKDYDKARTMLNGAVAKYLTDEKSAKRLAYALKIIINSVYGLTAAKFKNQFKDPRNIDNIVAKRGELFMINLKNEVQDRGFNVIHVKTDSIKIADPTPELEQFITDYGHLYGYNFEIEDIYERMCLVNKSVYIAKYAEPHKDEDGNDIWWNATGAQFAVPYVYKTLFSKEAIDINDLSIVFSVSATLYNDLNEELPDVTTDEKLLKKAIKDNDEDSITILKDKIKEGHNYTFVGRVGEFCPVLPGNGGGELMRGDNGKFSAIAGTKGYRWLESAFIREHHLEDIIDISYFQTLADEAKEEISKYGDFYSFAN